MLPRHTGSGKGAGVLAGALLAIVLAFAGVPGCAHQAGKNAASGFAAETRNLQESTRPEDQIVRIASGRAVEGAIDVLDDPAQQQRIQKIVNAAVAEAVATALRAALSPHALSGEATAALGTDGELMAGRGPAAILAGQIGRVATQEALGSFAVQLGGEGDLRKNLVATSAIATDAAVGAAMGEFFPECQGGGEAAAECRRGRMQALTRATAASFSAGVRDSLAWPLLFLAVAIGLTLGALIHWALTLRRRRPHAFRPV